MSTAVAPLVRQVVERARTEPGFAEVLDAILGAPTTPQGTLERVAARSLNDESPSPFPSHFRHSIPQIGRPGRRILGKINVKSFESVSIRLCRTEYRS